MNALRTSIIITNYNYGRFLPRCIESALAQSHSSEVIVVDDASQDGSRDIILGYGDKITPVLQERNGGQGAAFNAGFFASSGDVVFFLDADDWLYPNAVETVVRKLSSDAAQAQFRLHLVDGEGRRIDLLPPPEVEFDQGDVVPILLSRGRYECTVTSGNAFTRATLNSIMPIEEQRFRISADGYLVTVAPFFGQVVAIDEPLGAYAVHGANNWTGGIGRVTDPAKFRKSIAHDRDRYHALRNRAAERGFTLAADPGLADTQHLTSRIGSLTLEPAQHPEPGDRRFVLGLRGAWASRNANLSVIRRAMLATWFLAVGFVPRRWAGTLISWRLDPVTRPEGLRRILSAIRRRLARPQRTG